MNFNLLEAKKYVNDLKNKIIKQGAKEYFHIKHEDILLRLFDIVALNPGMIVDYNHLANDLDIDSRTIQTYFYYL